MVSSSLTCKHIADNLEKRVWAFSSNFKKGIHVCREQSKNISTPSKTQALEHTDDDVNPKVDQEVGARIESKVGISFR
jgi:hypothetical protein